MLPFFADQRSKIAFVRTPHGVLTEALHSQTKSAASFQRWMHLITVKYWSIVICHQIPTSVLCGPTPKHSVFLLFMEAEIARGKPRMPCPSIMWYSQFLSRGPGLSHWSPQRDSCSSGPFLDGFDGLLHISTVTIIYLRGEITSTYI